MTNEDKIIKLFTRTELRENEEVIDNRSFIIAEELSLTVGYVSETISEYLDNKLNYNNQLRSIKDLIYKENCNKSSFDIGNIILKEDSITKDLELELKALKIHSKNLSRQLIKLKEENKLLKSDSNKINKCNNLIKSGLRTVDITKALGYKNRSSLYGLVKRYTNMDYVSYRNTLLK